MIPIGSMSEHRASINIAFSHQVESDRALRDELEVKK
jgi:hypothetical protein